MASQNVQSPKKTVPPGQWNWNLSTFGIEFKCGNCCKKVTNAQFIFPVPPIFIGLLPPVGQCLTLELFGEEGVIDTQFLSSIFIPVHELCSIETEFLANGH